MYRTTAKDVASALLCVCAEKGISDISNLKLQKLVYYAQAWNLAFQGRGLFADNLEAWVHGPVVASLFGAYKHYRWMPITERSQSSAIGLFGDHLREVVGAYGHLTANELERLTHSEEPWVEARAGLSPDQPSRAIISTATMKRFYSSKVTQH